MTTETTEEEFEAYVENVYPDEEFSEDVQKCYYSARNSIAILPIFHKRSCVAGGFFARILRNEFDHIKLIKGDVDIFPYGSEYRAVGLYEYTRREAMREFKKYFNGSQAYVDSLTLSNNLDHQFNVGMYNKHCGPTPENYQGKSMSHGINIIHPCGNVYNLILDPNCLEFDTNGTLTRFDARHCRIGYDLEENVIISDKTAFFCAKHRILMPNNGGRRLEDHRVAKFLTEESYVWYNDWK